MYPLVIPNITDVFDQCSRNWSKVITPVHQVQDSSDVHIIYALYGVSSQIWKKEFGYLPRTQDWISPLCGITLFPVWPAFMMMTLQEVGPCTASYVMVLIWSSSCDDDTRTRNSCCKCCSRVCIESVHLSVDKWAKTMTKYCC